MKKRLIVITTVTLAVVAVILYLRLPGSVPRNQKPLVKLTPNNPTQFEAAFDGASNMPRVVLLLSPT